jgi:type II secretory ATPase GspE/PulE/Tfp pilus assembly ATPase PilB-like protein
MQLNDQKLKQLLLDQNYVSKADMAQADRYAQTYQASILDYLIAQEIITRDILGQAIAESLGLPYADLNTGHPSREQVLRIPSEVGEKFHAILFQETKDRIVVTSDLGKQKELTPLLQQIFPKKNIIIAYSLPEDVEKVLVYYRKALETRFAQIISESRRVAPEIIEEILRDAIVFKSSDIHFEPQRTEVIVRFRIDGVLQEAGRIPKQYYESILNRVKVQAHLPTDEHFSAQDGSMRYDHSGRIVDIRISIVPVIDGEKIVMRILAQYLQSLNLNELGLGAKDQEVLIDSSQKPFGMILTTGLTGSGKTTTLYGVMKLLNNPEVNVSTIEDPVEYKIQGVNHIQVNARTNLTFAKGLRSIVRQDPDIILVGEIRDEETAEIAVNAALTGHLLLSTFHANDAATAIPRLLDMGVEPFLLASTLELIIAQRLIRKICESCRYSYTVSGAAIKRDQPKIAPYLGKGKQTLYKGKGCNVCGNTGFRGRTAIYEIIKSTKELQDLIMQRPSSQEIWKVARAQGSSSLFEDGLNKVKNGMTTIEELLRVAIPAEQAPIKSKKVTV